MSAFPESDRILAHNRRYIPGGISSMNRLTSPNIAFVRGKGSRIWDAEGREYIDYHGAFAPQFLGFGHPHVTAAVKRVLENGSDLWGSGPTELEGRLAELICDNIPWVERLAILNSGSEATAQAIRLARAATSRDDIIVMQGGYNGWHNDVAVNLMTPLAQLGPRRSPGEYDVHPMSAGIPAAHQSLIHPVNYNDLESVRYVCERYRVAALITEPILQNIGLVKPRPGYLQGLRELADEFGFLLIFDEIKTGFRHSFGGYAEISGVIPDLAVYGKAIASGYPLAAIAGPSRWMDLFADSDPSKRVLLAGTYNAHPVPTAAAIATVEFLLSDGRALYRRLDALGVQIEDALTRQLAAHNIEGVVVRQGSAFVVFFMDHAPVDWHDLASNHNYELDTAIRLALLNEGVFFFPLATKQCSISAAHTADDIKTTDEAIGRALAAVLVTR
ncbi:MAG TPA: aminotransferase class III-fold pyridoxal phosphate-dependent enzyme [Bryobacterales bacterium]|nr:aminotransferase class III-fold pyridoxal phosphate-dependent enzyme [Bryobacterales bacterium]